METTENPPYITVAFVGHKYLVAIMVWSATEGDYEPSQILYNEWSESKARTYADREAKKRGLERR